MRLGLATGSAEPIHAQLARQVRAGVASGGLAPDERLAPAPELARELLVNPNTVERAYAELERDGFVERRGAGTFIARGALSPAARGRARKRFDTLAGELLAAAVHAGLTRDEAVAEVGARAGGFAFGGRGEAGGGGGA